MTSLNDTHDPKLTSWVPSANEIGSDFPIQNLPMGVFRNAGSNGEYRGGGAIGNQILDVGKAFDAGQFPEFISEDSPQSPDSGMAYVELGEDGYPLKETEV